MRWHILTALVGLLNGPYCTAVVVSNIKERRDVTGNLMDVHDGNIFFWQDRFYWVGMGYGNCSETHGLIPPEDCPGIYKPYGSCGFRIDHQVNVFSSSDLLAWIPEGNVLSAADRPTGIYFRPKILQHPTTGEFVLWINRVPPAPTPLAGYPHAVYVVATAATPAGPFVVVTPNASVAFTGAGDFTIFLDHSTAQGYIAYDAWANSHTVTIQPLTADLRNVNIAGGCSGPLSPSGNEAPIVFQRNDWFYLLFGHTCCFCRQGSDSYVYTARHPLGPWNNTGINLNPVVGGASFNHVIRAQENFVFSTTGTSATSTFVYTGDRWGSSPDHEKSHDLQFWQPLTFNDAVEPPAIEPLYWSDNCNITL